MKLSGSAFKTFLKRPNPSIFAALFFGPDRSLVLKHSKTLALAWGAHDDDPFSFTSLQETDLTKDPARLSDEMHTLAFTSAQRLIRLSQAGESSGKLLKDFFKTVDKEQKQVEAKLVVEGGDLSPRSALRKLFEQHKQLIAVGCYEETPQSLIQQAEHAFKDEGLELDSGARALFMAHLKGDHAHAMGEIEKLILFKGPKALNPSDQRRTITRQDVLAATLASTEARLDDFVFLTLGGVADRADLELHKLFQAKTAPFTLLRALHNHIMRLWMCACQVEEGLSVDMAMKSLKPPVFIFRQKDFLQHMKIWRKPLLERVLKYSLETERQMKRSYHADTLFLGRFVLDLARTAQKQRQKQHI